LLQAVALADVIGPREWAIESFDADHATAAAGAWRAEVLRFAWCVVIGRLGDVQEFRTRARLVLRAEPASRP
jgi:hypothetical protein